LKFKIEKWWQIVVLFAFIVFVFTFSAWIISDEIVLHVNGIEQPRIFSALFASAPWMIGVYWLIDKAFKFAALFKRTS